MSATKNVNQSRPPRLRPETVFIWTRRRCPTLSPRFCYTSKRCGAGPSLGTASAGQRDCRQKLDELRPYAPQLVAIAPDLEWVAQNELSIQLSISKIGSRNSLGSRFEGEGPNLLDIAVFSEGTFRRTSRASNPRNSSDLMPIPQEFMTDLAV
jgi:hypothetical protein